MYETRAVQVINHNYVNNNLECSEELLLGLLSLANNMPGINKEGIYLWHNAFNETHKQFFQLPSNHKDSIVGKTDYDIFPFNIATEFKNHDLEAMLSKNGVIKEEVFYNDKTNKKSIIFSYKRPLVNQMGETIGIIGNILNIIDYDSTHTENLKEINKIYNFTINYLIKEIKLLLNLIEINGDSESNVTMLSEINSFINTIFSKFDENLYA